MQKKRTIKGTSRAGVIPRREINAVVKAVHVVPFETKWKVQKTGLEGVTKVFETKQQALDYATALSLNKRVSLVIHSKNGQIEMKNGYRRDPRLAKS